MNLKGTYNKIAEEWHRDHQTDDWWISEIENLVSLMKAGGLVLDVGCGSGTKSSYLLEKGFQVRGIDFSESMIEIAKREVPEGNFRVLDLSNISDLDDCFDGIFMQAVLLHVPKKEASKRVQEIAEKLNEGGYFYITVKERRVNQKDEEVKLESDYGYPYERFFSYYTFSEIKKYFEAAGLVVIHNEATLTGSTTWLHIIAKKD